MNAVQMKVADRQRRAGHWLLVAAWCGLFGVAPAAAAAAAAADTDAGGPQAAEAAAMEVMDAFLEAFNAREESAWADTLQFPHVRLASGSVVVYPDRAAFLEAMDLNAFAEQTGWDYSTWDDMQIVQASADKVHIAVKFSRYDPEGVELSSYESLYVVERLDGRWGVRARSSFAP